MVKDEIISRITEKRARIGVIGLGYVGLPLLAEFARGGFTGIGFEVDAHKTALTNLIIASPSGSSRFRFPGAASHGAQRRIAKSSASPKIILFSGLTPSSVNCTTTSTR